MHNVLHENKKLESIYVEKISAIAHPLKWTPLEVDT